MIPLLSLDFLNFSNTRIAGQPEEVKEIAFKVRLEKLLERCQNSDSEVYKDNHI